jgi:hypothetical protein
MIVGSASTSISIGTPITIIAGGTAADRERWAEQAAQNGTDWASVLDGARDLLAVAVGEVTSMHTFDRACREADRRAASRPVDARTLRARRLLADDDISYERAYYETLRDRSAPEATIDALVYSLRRGINELTSPDAKRRLSELSEDQLRAVCERLRNFKPEIAPAWTPEEVEALTVIWSELK